MLIDLANETIQGRALQQAVTTTTQGASQDFHDTNVSLNAILTVGAVSGTTPSLTVQIEESADGSTNWTPVVADPVTGGNMAFTAVTTSNQLQVIKGLSSKQYVRANAVTVSGTSPSFETAVILVANAAKFPDSAPGYDRYPSS